MINLHHFYERNFHKNRPLHHGDWICVRTSHLLSLVLLLVLQSCLGKTKPRLLTFSLTWKALLLHLSSNATLNNAADNYNVPPPTPSNYIGIERNVLWICRSGSIRTCPANISYRAIVVTVSAGLTRFWWSIVYDNGTILECKISTDLEASRNWHAFRANIATCDRKRV